jgi:hypothetical protein
MGTFWLFLLDHVLNLYEAFHNCQCITNIHCWLIELVTASSGFVFNFVGVCGGNTFIIPLLLITLANYFVANARHWDVWAKSSE